MATKETKKSAKNEDAKAQVPAVSEAPAATQALSIPAQDMSLADQLTALGASPSLVKRAVKAASNFALMDTPKIPRIKALSDGLLLDENSDDEPLKELEGVIIFGAKYKSYYAKEYDPEVKELPDCFSHDGKVPEADVRARQNPVCKTCPKNQFESAKAGKGKACRDIRRLFILTSVTPGEERIMPIQLNVTPSSIKNWDDYMGKLVEYGMSYDEVQTKVLAKKKNREDKYVTLSFSKTKAFGEENPEEKQVLANIAALKTLWMPFMERQHVDLEETLEEQAAPAAPSATSGDF